MGRHRSGRSGDHLGDASGPRRGARPAAPGGGEGSAGGGLGRRRRLPPAGPAHAHGPRGGGACRGGGAAPDPRPGRPRPGKATRSRSRSACSSSAPLAPRRVRAIRMGDVARRRNVLLRNRMFRRMWTARAISFIGDGIAITALVLHVQSANGSGTAVGALLLAQALPHLVGPIAGVVADRTDQRRLMIGCDLGRMVVFAVAAWLLPGLPGSPRARRDRVDPGHGLRAGGPKRGARAGGRGGPALGERLARHRAQHAGGDRPAARRALRGDPRRSRRAGRGRGVVPAVGRAAPARTEAAAADGEVGPAELPGGHAGRSRLRASARRGPRGGRHPVPRRGVRRRRQRGARVPVARRSRRGTCGLRNRRGRVRHRHARRVRRPVRRPEPFTPRAVHRRMVPHGGRHAVHRVVPARVAGGDGPGDRRRRQRRGQRRVRHPDPAERAEGDARARVRRHRPPRPSSAAASRTRSEGRCSMRRRRGSSS